MAVLYVTEFSSFDPKNSFPVELSNATQTVAIGGSSTATTNALQNNTTVIRIHTDAICSIAIGTTPTATVTTRRMAANQTEYYTVPPSSGYKVAVITNT